MVRRYEYLRRLALASWAGLALLGAARGAAADYAVDSPKATVETLHKGLVELAAAKPQATIDERYAALVPLIEATHDLPYIAEFALRRQWPMLSESDRTRFVTAVERLSVMTYASSFTNVGPSTFKLTGDAKPQGERAQVDAAIARKDGPDVSLDYLLQHEAAGWKIINIVADGVSDLALKRAEYQRILANGTLDDLIKELDAQTARLK